MNILEKIYQDKLVEVRNKKKQVSGQELCRQIKCGTQQIKNFTAAIEQKLAQKQTAIIAEVKKASPSKGIIRADFDPLAIAQSYQQNGAACISVLTDEKYFMGKNEYLSAIAAGIDLPILRKDFMVDEYQIWEAKSIGASCILLIMAMLDQNRAIELEQAAMEIGLSVLIEIHDEEELKKALNLKSKLIGINNRNLKTFEISLDTTKNLAPQIPADRIIICESGIHTKADISEMQKIGVNSFLVGESLMRQDDVGKALKNLIN
ncbi:MAG: trpC [Rickettsiaceae bacterium]|jgi:indole-3-glycerol phosphate synthase|nr:trpC [Rickettsiaceae bacterium]